MIQELKYLNGNIELIEVPDTFIPCFRVHLRTLVLGKFRFNVIINVSNVNGGDICLELVNNIDTIDTECEFYSDSIEMDFNEDTLSYHCTSEYAYWLIHNPELFEHFIGNIKCSLIKDDLLCGIFSGFTNKNKLIGVVNGVGDLVDTPNGLKWNVVCGGNFECDTDIFFSRFMLCAKDNMIRLGSLEFGYGVYLTCDNNYFFLEFRFNKCVEVAYNYPNVVKHDIDININNDKAVAFNDFWKDVNKGKIDNDKALIFAGSIVLSYNFSAIVAQQIMLHKELIYDIVGSTCVMFQNGEIYDCYMLRNLFKLS